MLAMAAKRKDESPDDEKADTEQVNLRLPCALLNQLERIGAPLGLKRSYLIKQAVVEYVQRHELARQQQQTKPAR